MRKITYNLDWKTPMVTDTWFYFLSCFFLLTGRDFIFGMSSSKHHVLGVSQNPVLNHYFWKPLQALSIHERNWPPLGLVLFIMMCDLRHVMYPIGIQSKILIGKYTWGFLRFYMQQPIFHTGNASYACHLLCPQLPHFLADSPSYYLSLFPHPPYLTASSSYLPFLFVTFFCCWTLSFYPL